MSIYGINFYYLIYTLLWNRSNITCKKGEINRMDTLDWIAVVLTVIGALNWGLVGLFNLDLVALLFGTMSLTSRLIYILVGISGIYLIYTASKLGGRDKIKQ